MKKAAGILFFLFVVATVAAQGVCVKNETVSDSEGNVYETVQIGRQCWMKENMRTLRAADGQPLTLADFDSVSYDIPYAYYPGNDESNVSHDGLLYNWAAARTVCPPGWHLPSSSDFFALTTYLKEEMHLIDEIYLYKDDLERFPGYENFTMGKALADTAGWSDRCYDKEGTVGNNQQANNRMGFSARPAGTKSWNERGAGAYFWLSDYYVTPKHPRYMQLQACRLGVYTDDFLSATEGMSVRCIRETK